MPKEQQNSAVRHRVLLAALGGLAALALWALAELWWQHVLPPAAYLALFGFLGVYSSVVLALSGPVSVPRAVAGALILAVPATLLISLAGAQQVVATDLLDEPAMLSVIVLFVFFSTPFLLVWLCDPARWRDYAALFDAAWSMVVRYGVAWGFVAVFWLLVFLSDALLELVGIGLMDHLLRLEPVRYGVSGAMLGLGLAVVHEMRRTFSPYLFLRLLRLLVPPVLAVIAVFLAAVPFRGLTDLFGEFSAAATLMGAAIMGITLVSAALDRDDAHAVSTPGIVLATRALAGLLPFLALLAVWAVILRVRQYGWTPDRLLATCVALFLLAYGAGYAVAVIRGSGWAERVRRINVRMALAVVAATALWLTPLLDPYRISAESQIARYQAGRSDLGQLPLWAFQHEWGRAGRDALVRLEQLARPEDRAELAAIVGSVRSAPDRFRFEQTVRERQAPDLAARLAQLMPVQPAGTRIDGDVWESIPHYRLSEWIDGCRRTLPDGRPGCVFVAGSFSPAAGTRFQGMVFFLDGQGAITVHYLRLASNGTAVVSEVYDPVRATWPQLPPTVLGDIQEGKFTIAPTAGNALVIGDSMLVPQF